jgi:hypothetical protein
MTTTKTSETRRASLLTLCLAAPLVSLLAACATAPGPQFSGIAAASKEHGDVYIYRTSGLFAAAQSFAVNLDDKKSGDLFNGSYLHMRLNPGSYKFAVVPGGFAKVSELQVSVEAGKTYFYQYDFVSGALGNVFFLGAEIVPRPAEHALKDMKELKAAK